MSEDRPKTNASLGSGDASSPARKSGRLQIKRRRMESVSPQRSPKRRPVHAGDAVQTRRTGSLKQKVQTAVTSKNLQESDEEDEESDSEQMDLKSDAMEDEDPSQQSPTTPRAESSESMSGADRVRAAILEQGIEIEDGKVLQVVVKGPKMETKTVKIVRVAEGGAPAGKSTQSVSTAGPEDQQPSLQSPVKEAGETQVKKEIIKPAPGKDVSKNNTQGKEGAVETGPAKPTTPPPPKVKLTAKVYASAEKSKTLKASERKSSSATHLNSEDAMNLVTSMRGVLAALDTHTFSEEIFECATAVVKPSVAAILKDRVPLIQQICGLTAVSVVEVGGNLFLFGPVNRLHKAKMLLEKMKAKGYQRTSPEENKLFQASDLKLVLAAPKKQPAPPPPAPPPQPAKPAVDPLLDVPMFQQDNQGELFSTQDDEDEDEDAIDNTMELEELPAGTHADQSLMEAVVDQLAGVEPNSIVIKAEGGGEAILDAQTLAAVEPAGAVEYACDMCCVSFDSEDTLTMHTNKVYHQANYKKWSSENPYQCGQCYRRCKDPRVLTIHEPQCQTFRSFRRIVNGRIVPQDVDLETSNVLRLTWDMVNEWRNTHPDDDNDYLEDLVDDDERESHFQDEVDGDFDPDDNENNLEDVKKKKRRFIGDASEKMHCVHCDKVLTKSAFYSHCVYKHSGWTYFCPLCPRQANRRGSLLRHLVVSHKNSWREGEVQVLIHGNISNTVLQTKVYMTGPHRNDYPCAHCSQTFADARDCAHHTFRHHTAKQFACAWCCKLFGALHHLTFHSAAVHGRVMVADETGSYTIEKSIDDMQKKDQLCNICGELYRSKARHQKVCMKPVSTKKRAIKTEHPPITQEMVDKFPDSFKYIHDCDQCGYITTAKGLISHRKFMHFNRSLYACTLCPIFGNTEEAMEAHLKRKHFRSKQFREGLQCTIMDEMPEDDDPENGVVICVNSSCIRLPPSVKMRDYYALLYDRKQNIDNTTTASCDQCGFVGKAHIVTFHKINVHGRVHDICPLCRKPMRDEGILSRHIATEHFEDGNLVYSTRHRPKQNPRESIISERTVLGNPEETMIECPTCHKMIKPSYMKSHEKIHVKSATCEICSAAFRCQAELRKHMVRKHTPEELVCKQCDTGFQTIADLQHHVKVTHDNQMHFTCPHCPNRTFENKRYLKVHLQRKHTNPHRHECPECGKMFFEKCKRDQHRRTHLPDNAEGRFRAHCDICKKYFKSESYLETHMNLHTKATLFACPVCNRRFNLQSTLKKHQLTHTDEPRFPCDHPGCNRMFKTVTKLKYHKVTHTKDSPYVCKTCDKVFTQPWTLKKHSCKFEQEDEQEIQTLFPQSSQQQQQGESVTMMLANGQLIQAVDNASGEAILEIAQPEPAIPKQEQLDDEGETVTADAVDQYQCSVCNYVTDTLQVAIDHVASHSEEQQQQQGVAMEQQEQGVAIEQQEQEQEEEGQENAAPVEQVVQEIQMVEDPDKVLSVESLEQQIQVEDADGNRHYVTINLDNADSEQVIQVDASALASFTQQ